MGWRLEAARLSHEQEDQGRKAGGRGWRLEERRAARPALSVVLKPRHGEHAARGGHAGTWPHGSLHSREHPTHSLFNPRVRSVPPSFHPPVTPSSWGRQTSSSYRQPHQHPSLSHPVIHSSSLHQHKEGEGWWETSPLPTFF